MAANPVQEAAVQAVELDAFAKRIPDLVQHDDTVYSLFKAQATTVPIANITAAGGTSRPSFRIPVRIQAGAALSQGTGNGDSLGRGTGSQWAGMAVGPYFLYSVNEITFLSRIATEGRKRGLFNVQAQELDNSYKQAVQGIEALIQGDGSGYLDQIPATATITSGTPSSIVGMTNAFQFTDQQTVQVFSAIGGTNRGSFVISFVDPVTQTIYSAGPLPAGTTNGDFLIINGASGSANGSVLGIKAWQTNSSTGTIGGLTRSNYPGRLSTPNINLNGGSIALSTGYRALTLLMRALGANNPGIDSSVWVCGPDQAMQIANLYYNVLFVNGADVKADVTPDIVKKSWPSSYAGRKLVVGMAPTPGRLDLLHMGSWYLGEMLPLELYDFGGGMTVAPVPDIVNGGYLTSTVFAYVTALNLANANPRAGVYVTNAATPTI